MCFCLCTFFLTGFLSVSRQFLAKFEVRERLAITQNWRSNLNLGFKTWRQKMQERTLEQERKWLKKRNKWLFMHVCSQKVIKDHNFFGQKMVLGNTPCDAFDTLHGAANTATFTAFTSIFLSVFSFSRGRKTFFQKVLKNGLV